MNRTAVAATGITQVGYDPGSETLEIKFEKDGVYQFFNVPSDLFDELMSAPSKEEFYRHNIGKRFPCSRVG